MKELTAIQSNLNAPKNQINKFGGYKYRSAEDILAALKPLLQKHNCYLTISDEIKLVGERYYIVATASIFNTDKECVSVTGYAREEESKKGMDGSQITGASSSYARKYALNGLFGIDDVKDSDATNDNSQDVKKELQSKFQLLTKDWNAEQKKEFAKKHNFNKLNDLSIPQLQKIISDYIEFEKKSK